MEQSLPQPPNTMLRPPAEALLLAGHLLGGSDNLQVCLIGQDPIPCSGKGMGRETLPAGMSRRVGQDVGPHQVGSHCWAAMGGPVHVRTHHSGPHGKEVRQRRRTDLQTPGQDLPIALVNQAGGLEPTDEDPQRCSPTG